MIETIITCPEHFKVIYETYQGRIQKREMVLGNAVRVKTICQGKDKNCPETCPIEKLISKLEK